MDLLPVSGIRWLQRCRWCCIWIKWKRALGWKVGLIYSCSLFSSICCLGVRLTSELILSLMCILFTCMNECVWCVCFFVCVCAKCIDDDCVYNFIWCFWCLHYLGSFILTLCWLGYLNCDDVMCHISLGFWLDAMMAGGLWPGTRPS